MATKEVMVTAPLLVLLYDRTFAAGSFKSAIRKRWGFYTGLSSTWVILFILTISGPRSESAGFSIGISPLDYAMTQFGVIVHYLRLSFWPVGLCLDYGWPAAKTAQEIIPPMVLVMLMAGITLWGLVYNQSWAYPAVWFFGILAPSSSFVPIADMTFEHRMYLPLAGIAVICISGGFLLLQRTEKQFVRRIGIFLLIVILVMLGTGTIRRNEEYHSEELLWRRITEVAVNNPRGHFTLGNILYEQGKITEAIESYRKGIEVKPDDAQAHNNLGIALQLQGKVSEAVSHFEKVLEIWPDSAEAHNNIGNILKSQGKVDEAILHFKRALESKYDNAEEYKVHNNLGKAFFLQGKSEEAIEQYNKALRQKPDYADAHYNAGTVFESQGKSGEAIRHFKEAVKSKGDYFEAHYKLAGLLQAAGRLDEAIIHYRNVVEIRPDWPVGLNSLAWLLATEADSGDVDEAIELAERAAELTRHQDAYILDTLAAAYAALGRYDEAIETEETALELALAGNNEELSNHIRRQLELYRKEKPK
jgi:Tfp pilus assembly protein PilF